MEDEFGNIGSSVEDTEPNNPQEQSLLDEQQRRLEQMVKDKKWIPLLEVMLQKVEYYRSMQWIDPQLSNEEIGQNAKVGAIVISELEGILNEVKAVAGFEFRDHRLTGSPTRNKKTV
jgi:hypothetical protein